MTSPSSPFMLSATIARAHFTTSNEGTCGESWKGLRELLIDKAGWSRLAHLCSRRRRCVIRRNHRRCRRSLDRPRYSSQSFVFVGYDYRSANTCYQALVVEYKSVISQSSRMSHKTNTA